MRFKVNYIAFTYFNWKNNSFLRSWHCSIYITPTPCGNITSRRLAYFSPHEWKWAHIKHSMTSSLAHRLPAITCFTHTYLHFSRRKSMIGSVAIATQQHSWGLSMSHHYCFASLSLTRIVQVHRLNFKTTKITPRQQLVHATLQMFWRGFDQDILFTSIINLDNFETLILLYQWIWRV